MIATLYDGYAGQIVVASPDQQLELPVVSVQLFLDDMQQLANDPELLRTLLAQFLPRALNG